MKLERYLTVHHTIEDDQHVVRIYSPTIREDYKIGRWPVSETNTSLDAIEAGYLEAAGDMDLFRADGVAIYSSDAEALARWITESDADE